MLALDFLDWLLVRSGAMVYTPEQLNAERPSKADHFIGFELGRKERERAEMKKDRLRNM